MKHTILAYLRSRAHGIENKASREEIIQEVRSKLYVGADNPPRYSWLEREVRRVIAETPEICSVNGGYFIARNASEARVSYDYHHKRGMAELTRAARIRDAYPEVAQRELWG